MSVYIIGSIVGKAIAANIFGVKISAGIVEWGLIMGALAFLLNIIFSSISYRSMSPKTMNLIHVLVTAPIIEEFIYRFLLISIFTVIFNSVIIAVVLSAVLFAFLHVLYGGFTFIDCVITGIIWGWAFLSLGLGVTIIAHVFHNVLVSIVNR